MANTEKTIALTDGTVVRGITWTTRKLGPVGAEVVPSGDATIYGEVPLADDLTFYPSISYSYGDVVEDTQSIATGYSVPVRRE